MRKFSRHFWLILSILSAIDCITFLRQVFTPLENVYVTDVVEGPFLAPMRFSYSLSKEKLEVKTSDLGIVEGFFAPDLTIGRTYPVHITSAGFLFQNGAWKYGAFVFLSLLSCIQLYVRAWRKGLAPL